MAIIQDPAQTHPYPEKAVRNPAKPTSGKHDSEKPRTALVLGGFANALLAVSVVGTFGARKYSDNGWQKMEAAEERVESAMLRHWLAVPQARRFRVEACYDSESQLLHKAHLAWNALAALELELHRLPLHLTDLPDDKE